MSKKSRPRSSSTSQSSSSQSSLKHDEVCSGLKFEECELAILRMNVDKAGKNMGKQLVQHPATQDMIRLLEEFIRKKKCICYGGTAINNILPQDDRFYDSSSELPDYDVFTPHALQYAKDLADVYVQNGYSDVEATSGVHHGTYKVYVNFIAVADITYLPTEIFECLYEDALKRDGILYAPPNFLRMSMYLELSRPQGDISRWEKVMKRLTLLNKHYPVSKSGHCAHVELQRLNLTFQHKKSLERALFASVKKTLIEEKVVFFGGYAQQLYSRYMPHHHRKKAKEIADFDVLAEDIKYVAEEVAASLSKIEGIPALTWIHHRPVGEIVPEHMEVKVGEESILFIYKPMACHNYNEISMRVDGQEMKVRVATIDTMLSFYFAFLYVKKWYFNENFSDRILCMSQFLFEVQQKNRLAQKGLLKRFSLQCYGTQSTLAKLKAEKAKKYSELKNNPEKKDEYEAWFLKYTPRSSSYSRRSSHSSQNSSHSSPSRRSSHSSKNSKNSSHSSAFRKAKTPPLNSKSYPIYSSRSSSPLQPKTKTRRKRGTRGNKQVLEVSSGNSRKTQPPKKTKRKTKKKKPFFRMF